MEIYRKAQAVLNKPSPQSIFTGIYLENSWESSESVSGRGSTSARTVVIRRQLPILLQDLQATTLFDAACGDFNWMQYTDLGVKKYIGADIVTQLVVRNQQLYGRNDRSFIHLDVTRDKLPTVDVILCRDCLIHLSFESVHAAISNFKKSGSTYLLATTHDSIDHNVDTHDGDWRSLNLQFAPFNFPEPRALIVEDAELGKCLGVWRIGDL